MKTTLEKKTDIHDFREERRANIKSREYSAKRQKQELEEVDKACEEALMEIEQEKGTGL